MIKSIDKNLYEFLEMYKSLHGIHITLGDFWPQFLDYMEEHNFAIEPFTKNMSITTAIHFAKLYYGE